MSVVTDQYTIDLGEGSNLTLTKSIYDITEPDKRKSHFTKTITVPASATNDLVFQGMFDVNFHLTQTGQFEPFFNPTKKAPCYLHTETMEQMTGYAQLTDIVNVDGKIEYKITLYGEVRDLFAELSNKKLSELDLSEYNHLYNETNIEASWTTPIGEGYVYPMIDYGDDHTNYDNRTNNLPEFNFWVPEHFRPWIYVKTIVDKIIQDSGFKYSSSFLNSDLFKKLIYQGEINGLVKDDTLIDEYSISVNRTTSVSVGKTLANQTASYCYTNYPINFNNEVHDPQTQFATPDITVSSLDYYNILGLINVNLINNGASNIGGGDTYFSFSLAIIDDLGNIAGASTFTRKINDFTGSSVFAVSANFTFTMSVNYYCLLNPARTYRLCVRNLVFTTGGIANYIGSRDVTIEIETDSSLAVVPSAETVAGATVLLSGMLDDKMTQKDFMMNIVRMFNLYIEPYWFRTGDANSGLVNTYLIEPRDDYFISDVIDWTENLDLSREFTIKPNGLVDSKFYKFTYAEDNDRFNAIYTGQSGRVMGDYIHQIDNDFVKETKEIKIGFAPTIISSTYNTNHYKQPMPVIVNNVDDPTKRKRIDGKPRILFYNGLKSCGNWTFNAQGQYTQYPLASNFDDWDNPTTDLNFSQPSAVYYSGDANGQYVFTNGTLFNKYYYRQVTETTDINSRVMECYMRLRDIDIHNLSFRPYYFIRDAYYRLYEVVDHNYTETTLCRFLKISEATPITNALLRTRGGRITMTGTTEKTPTKIGDRIPDTVRSTGYGGLIVNGGGGVKADGTVGQGFVKSISGNNVFVGGNYTNEILQDNIFAVGFNYLYVASGTTTLTGMEGSPLYVFVDTSLGNAVLVLPDESLFDGSIIQTQKQSASHQLTITDFADVVLETCTSDKEKHAFLLTSQGVETIH